MTLFKRLLALVRKSHLDADLDGEITAHLELAERDAIEAGLSPTEARRTARLKFGGVANMKEEHRDRRSVRWMETFTRDLRYGLASLVRDPSFSLIAIGVLALGIGANTAMFSLVDAVFLRPLPFPEPDRLVKVWEAPEPGRINGINTLDFLDWKRLNTVFEALSAERYVSLAMTGEGEPVRLAGRLVSSDYFQIFGIDAVAGRTFLPEEEQSGAPPVIVLSDATWRTVFGSDPNILSRDVMLDNEPHAVVGVLSPSAFDRDSAAFYKPLIFRPHQMNRSFHWLRSVGRLKPGVTLEQAQEEMSTIDANLTELTPDWKKEWGVMVEPYDRRLIDAGLRASIPVAFGAVALVLLIACANVANLLLAKGAARRREMAVRAALGASRGRLIRQLLTESLVLCLFGAVAGVGLAQLLIQAIEPIIADSLPFTADVALDSRVLAFSAAAAFGVALLIGLLPSIQTSFSRLSEAMNQGSRGASSSREGLRRMIVIGEVALSLALVCGSLLLFKSLYQLQQVDPGVRIEQVMTMSLDLPVSSYPEPDNAILFYRRLTERLGAIPGVAQAALSTDAPLTGVRQGEGVGIPGKEGRRGVPYKRISPGYLDTFDISLIAGRNIEASDTKGTPSVALINEQLAAALKEEFEVSNPIGQRLTVDTPNYENSSGSIALTEVVGIIRSERTDDLNSEQAPVIYVPLAQVPRMNLQAIVRTQAAPSALMPSIREAIRSVDPSLPIGKTRTMEQVRDSRLTGAKQPTWVIGAFAAVAALLAALGLYGVLSHTVMQRRREIGIRMALGAQSTDVLSQVLRDAMSLVVVGVAIGLAGALALTRVIESLLFEVSAFDPLAMAAACVAMLLVGLVAGFIPARRAAAVEPMTVLREES